MSKRVKIYWKSEILSIFLIFLLGGVFQLVVWADLSRSDFRYFAISFTYSGLFWTFLWKGSEYLVPVMDGLYSWSEQPVRRLIVGLLGVSFYTIFVVYFLDFMYDFFVFGKKWDEALLELNGSPLVTTILITLGINTFMHGRGFLLDWRQISIDIQKLKTEQVFTQFQSLKNQVNPHFLFNSLNALSSLVYEDQDKAVDFIRKLSRVYRYVLDKKDSELVKIEDELDFMENFIFLQKIRFGDNLNVSLKKESTEGYLPPLALQLLVENAIKHNVISEKDPLTISIEIGDTFCIVSNTIKEKLEKDSTGIGIENLRARYEYLSNKKLEIENDGKKFIVKLPVLQLDK
jgi:hypothetical protein